MARQMDGDKNSGRKIGAQMLGQKDQRFDTTRRGSDGKNVTIDHAMLRRGTPSENDWSPRRVPKKTEAFFTTLQHHRLGRGAGRGERVNPYLLHRRKVSIRNPSTCSRYSSGVKPSRSTWRARGTTHRRFGSMARANIARVSEMKVRSSSMPPVTRIGARTLAMRSIGRRSAVRTPRNGGTTSSSSDATGPETNGAALPMIGASAAMIRFSVADLMSA